MYTKEYIDGKTLLLKYENGEVKYKVIFVNGSIELYEFDGNDYILVDMEDEPRNEIKFLNVYLIDKTEIANVLGTNIINNCSVDDVGISDIYFPFSNFRFKDGSRESIYFCVVNDDIEFNKDVILPYYISSNESKKVTYSYEFKFDINGVIDTNKDNYILVPRYNNILVSIDNIQIDEPLYCIISKRQDVIEECDIEYKTFNNIQSTKFDDIFSVEGYDGDYVYISDNDDNYSLKTINNLKTLYVNNNKIKFNYEDYLNGEVNVYVVNNSDNCVYEYIGSCLIEKCMPKIEVNIEKHNSLDLDYIINKGDRTLNYYNITDGQNNLGNSLVLMKDYSYINDNMYDVPKYDAKVSAYIPKFMVDEGYVLGQNVLKIVNKDENFELVSLNDVNDETLEGYNLRTETFKFNYDNVEQNKYIYNEISSTNVIDYNDVYFIKSKNGKYLDYGTHSININEDNRIVYHN